MDFGDICSPKNRTPAIDEIIIEPPLENKPVFTIVV
jgi:hypothetical protein